MARDAGVESARGTTTRNVQSGSPLGSVRNAGSWERRPTSLTWLTHSSGSGIEPGEGGLLDALVDVEVFDPFVRADMHLTSAPTFTRGTDRTGSARAALWRRPRHGRL